MQESRDHIGDAGVITQTHRGLGARRDGQVSYGTQRGPLRAAAVRP